ncbi:hypothetical protein ABZS86_17595 [Streptomyces sp. NPDC005355]
MPLLVLLVLPQCVWDSATAHGAALATVVTTALRYRTLIAGAM